MTGPGTGLPPTWRLSLDPLTRSRADGRVLLGGTPFRVWRLDDRGAATVARLIAGEPIGTDPLARGLARRLLDAGMAVPRPEPGGDPATVTVVVPFHGPADELAATLDALVATAPGVAELVIVDDAAPDGAAVADVAERHGARLLRHDHNRGPAAARNTGWQAARTEVVAFVDGGCLPDPGWLAHLLPHLADPAVAVVAPRIATTPSTTLPGWVAAYETARPSLDRGPTPATVRPGSAVPFVPAATLVARRADLAASGGFDEALRYGEDVDLVWRLGQAGRTVRYEPAATVRHVSRGTPASWLRQRFGYGTSAAPLTRRHPTAVRPLQTARPVAAAWALAGAGLPVPALATAAVTAARLVPRVGPVPHPVREAVALATRGHVHAGRAAAAAVRREWWPLAAVAAVASRRARRTVAVAALLPPLAAWARRRPALDPVRWTALHLADDAAYGLGVWAGCGRERSLRALVPSLVRAPRARS